MRTKVDVGNGGARGARGVQDHIKTKKGVLSIPMLQQTEKVLVNVPRNINS